MGCLRHHIPQVRAQQAYVAQYVAERQAAYGAEPARRQKEEWKSRARATWVRLEREGVVAREGQVQKKGEGDEGGKGATGVRGGRGGLAVRAGGGEGVGIVPAPFPFFPLEE
jgi:hypothetical protein